MPYVVQWHADVITTRQMNQLMRDSLDVTAAIGGALSADGSISYSHVLRVAESRLLHSAVTGVRNSNVTRRLWITSLTPLHRDQCCELRKIIMSETPFCGIHQID